MTISSFTAQPQDISAPIADDQSWPQLGSPGVDEDLAYAIAHARKASALAGDHPDWLVGIDVLGAEATLTSYSPRSAAAADLTIDDTTLAEHLDHAIQACGRYLDRYPFSSNVSLARHDLASCRYGLDA